MTGRHGVPTAQTSVPETASFQETTPNASAQTDKHPKTAFDRSSSMHGQLSGSLLTNLLLLVLTGTQIFSLLHRPTYEYQTVSPSDYTFEGTMNALGAKGWKTESCRRASSGGTYSSSFSYECIVSRPKLGW